MKRLIQFYTDEQGQDLIEYTLILAFVALGAAALYTSVGTSISGIWTTTNTKLGAASTAAS